MNRATRLVHGGRAPRGDVPAAPPPTSTANSVAATPYDREPDPSVVERLHRRLAELEGTESALVLSSGASATRCTMLALLRAGDHLVSSAWFYGDTRRFLEQELPAMGIDVTFIDPTETRAWRRAMRPNTRVLFLESPVNPTTRVVDLRPARVLAQAHGVALVVDSTFATPINCRPIEHGADVVMHSTAHHLSGECDVLAGVVCGAEAVIDEVRAKMMLEGHAPDPHLLWLLDRGLNTLDIRLQRQNHNALQLAQWAASQPAIRAVHYPGLSSHADHAWAATTMDGFGSALAIELAGGNAAVARTVARLALFSTSMPAGGVASTISNAPGISPRRLVDLHRAAISHADGFLRLSVGVEYADDLIADLSHAWET